MSVDDQLMSALDASRGCSARMERDDVSGWKKVPICGLQNELSNSRKSTIALDQRDFARTCNNPSRCFWVNIAAL